MTELSDLRPGDIMTTATFGTWWDRTMANLIRFGTATTDPTGKWVNSRVNHAAVYVGDGKIVEAVPGGAIKSNWDKYGDTAVWSVNGLGQHRSDGTVGQLPDITDAQREKIAANACKLIGVPYGFADLIAVGFGQKRLHLGLLVDLDKPMRKQPWWVRRVTDGRTLICSQLVDVAYMSAGVHLFDDDRVPGLVSPNDLRGLYL